MRSFRICAAVIMVLLCGRIIFGNPVEGEKIQLRQPDGILITGFVFGDEFHHRIESEEGYTLIKNNRNGFIEYALLEAGRLVPSGIIAGRHSSARLREWGLRKHLSDRSFRIAELRRLSPDIFHERIRTTSPQEEQAAVQPLTGTKKVFLICVDFQPEADPPTHWSNGFYPPAGFENRLFSAAPGEISMTNFYKAASFNRFWPVGDAFPDWIRLPQTASWYKQNDSWKRIVQDAMTRIRDMQPSYDFTRHANGGIMDIIVVWAGIREEWGDFYWPKKGTINLNHLGVTVKYYNAVNERLGGGDENTGISVFCHEYGHMTGCPDLYDYSDFQNKPVGRYCIMGSSNYQYNFCGYLKWSNYGWVQPFDIVNGGVFLVDALGGAAASNPRLYRISIEFPHEYLLLENRFNGAHPDYENASRRSGLLITHVDERYPPAACQPSYPFYGLEAVVPVLDPTIKLLAFYAQYWDKMVFAADYGSTQLGPTYPDNVGPGAYIELKDDQDTEHVIYRNTRGHTHHADIHITDIGLSGPTMSFRMAKDSRTLILSATEGGRTDPAPGTHVFDRNREVTVSVIEDEFYALTSWSGNPAPTNPPAVTQFIKMDVDRTLRAHFTKIQAPLQPAVRMVLNRSLSQAQYIHVLSWASNPANDGLSVSKYRVYRVSRGIRNLLGEVNAGVFEYWNRNADPLEEYSYEVNAVALRGREGEPASINWGHH
ncbi:MAG: immune inhibitor A domain-containing protein [Acidobacteriota bacterium]